MRTSFFKVLVPVAFAVVAIAAVSSASTARKSTVVVHGNTTGAQPLKAKCKGSQQAISGGFESPRHGSPVFPLANGPIGGKTWATRIDAGAESVSISSYAYCSAGDVTTREQTFEPTAFSRKKVSVKCPQGKQVVSGGWLTPTDQTSVVVDSSYRDGKRTWSLKAISQEEGGKLTAFALCQKQGVKTRAKSGEIGGSGSHRTGYLTAKCKGGEKIVSGGFKLPQDVNQGGPFLLRDLKKGKSAWQIGVYFYKPGTTHVYAYCR
ncbi:hypothetical protein BH10ACT11_BH10ACT11_19980 [soil metagenome]